ncbi:WhiB family transcriptional regulator [Enteractinococcus helveticum]|uniref:WhiB family transcriptional regulator n=1 Tax=Enteractinococcus helveticum TaxID=1837282 RepID=UPI0026EDB559|nr:WhiB family transcriptional regulator [Enteractinococcus helveticum]
MDNAQRAEHARVEGSSVTRNGREVPVDWFVDPADPGAGQDLTTLDERATAYLAAHDAITEITSEQTSDATVTALHPTTPAPYEDETVDLWQTLPGFGDTADDGQLAWQADALCAQTDPEAFFPEKGGSTRDAKKVCGACPVKQQCLEYALSNDERFGIWGGMSERERRRLRKKSS